VTLRQVISENEHGYPLRPPKKHSTLPYTRMLLRLRLIPLALDFAPDRAMAMFAASTAERPPTPADAAMADMRRTVVSRRRHAASSLAVSYPEKNTVCSRLVSPFTKSLTSSPRLLWEVSITSTALAAKEARRRAGSSWASRMSAAAASNRPTLKNAGERSLSRTTLASALRASRVGALKLRGNSQVTIFRCANSAVSHNGRSTVVPAAIS